MNSLIISALCLSQLLLLPYTGFCQITLKPSDGGQFKVESGSLPKFDSVKNAKRLAEDKAMEERIVGKPLAAFSGNTIEGFHLNNDSLKGKVIMVVCWYIGCFPCMLEIPHLNKLNKEYAGKNFKLISFATHTKDNVRSFLGENTGRKEVDTSMRQMSRMFKISSVDYPIIPTCDTSKIEVNGENIRMGPDCDYLIRTFGFAGYPASFIVDKKGIVRKFSNGFEMSFDKDFDPMVEYREIIDKLLKEE